LGRARAGRLRDLPPFGRWFAGADAAGLAGGDGAAARGLRRALLVCVTATTHPTADRRGAIPARIESRRESYRFTIECGLPGLREAHHAFPRSVRDARPRLHADRRLPKSSVAPRPAAALSARERRGDSAGWDSRRPTTASLNPAWRRAG